MIRLQGRVSVLRRADPETTGWRFLHFALAQVEGEGIGVLLVTHDLEEAIALADRVYLLSKGPRARIAQAYTVPFPRPRDPVGVKADPRFGPLFRKLWQDLEGVSLCAAP